MLIHVNCALFMVSTNKEIKINYKHTRMLWLLFFYFALVERLFIGILFLIALVYENVSKLRWKDVIMMFLSIFWACWLHCCFFLLIEWEISEYFCTCWQRQRNNTGIILLFFIYICILYNFLSFFLFGWWLHLFVFQDRGQGFSM